MFLLTQVVVDDFQSLLSLPVVPFTYQVVLAKAAGARVRNSAIERVPQMGLMLCLRSKGFLQGRKADYILLLSRVVAEWLPATCCR